MSSLNSRGRGNLNPSGWSRIEAHAIKHLAGWQAAAHRSRSATRAGLPVPIDLRSPGGRQAFDIAVGDSDRNRVWFTWDNGPSLRWMRNGSRNSNARSAAYAAKLAILPTPGCRSPAPRREVRAPPGSMTAQGTGSPPTRSSGLQYELCLPLCCAPCFIPPFFSCLSGSPLPRHRHSGEAPTRASGKVWGGR